MDGDSLIYSILCGMKEGVRVQESVYLEEEHRAAVMRRVRRCEKKIYV